MIENDKISVIVPAYNVEKYLKRCIESLLAQTYNNFEIILVEDGSTDKTGALCDELGKRDTRIHVIHQKNGGLSKARNTGILHSSGTYLVFVDSDDWVKAKYLEVLYRLIVESSAQIAACGTEICSENGHLSYHNDDTVLQTVMTNQEAMQELPKDTLLRNVAWNKMYHRELFNKVRFPEGMIFEDIATTYKLIAQAGKIVYTGAPLYCYFKSEHSILRSDFSVKWFDRVTAFKRCAVFYMKHYPEYAVLPTMNYIRSAFSTLCRSARNKEQYRMQRKKVRAELLHWISLYGIDKLPLKECLSWIFLRAGLPLYDMIVSVPYAFARKLSRKTNRMTR